MFWRKKHVPVLRLLNLKFGACKLVIAGKKDVTLSSLQPPIKVATKYIRLTQKFFEKKYYDVVLIKLHGAIELAPVTGMSDLISDLTETGKTLQAHNLYVKDEVMHSSVFLVASQLGYRMHYSRIRNLVSLLSKVST